MIKQRGKQSLGKGELQQVMTENKNKELLILHLSN